MNMGDVKKKEKKLLNLFNVNFKLVNEQINPLHVV